MSKVKVNDPVLFYPSERTLKSFKKKKREFYAAVVTDVNKDTVDLTVFGVGEVVHVANIKDVEYAEAGRSYYVAN